MRPLRLILVLALAVAGSAGAQPRAVQQAVSMTPNGAALALTFPAPSALGNVIVVAVFSGGLPTSVADSLGTSFQLVGTVPGAAGFVGRQVAVYWGVTTSTFGFGNTVVVRGTTALVPLAMVIVEYAGLSNVIATLDASEASGGPVSALSSPVVLARSDDLLLWWVACEGALTGLDGGFSLRGSVGGNLVAELVVPVDGPTAAAAAGSCTNSVYGLYRFTSFLGGGDAGVVDGGAVDAGGFDGGGVDAGDVDAGGFDAGDVDGGGVDGGGVDGGGVDGGFVDGGDVDGGVGDAGAPDGGPGQGEGPRRYAIGCDCGAAPLPSLAVLLGLFFVRRRTRAFRLR